jgi:hypothetical protein
MRPSEDRDTDLVQALLRTRGNPAFEAALHAAAVLLGAAVA